MADNLYEHVHAPLSTLFWQAPWACDGTPGGYAVYEFDGGKVNWYYKCVGRDKDYQFELYPVGASRNKKEAVVANVWNYDPTWKVKWYENGIDRGEMTRFPDTTLLFMNTVIKTVLHLNISIWEQTLLNTCFMRFLK